MTTRQTHWNDVYSRRAPTDVSWFQREPARSLALIENAQLPTTAAIVDVGAGASTLVDALLSRGYRDVTLLDVAEHAFDATRARLGKEADAVRFIASDVTRWTPPRTYALWHDRAAFHFLTEEEDRARYRDVLMAALAPGGQAIVATFALDGPERCSGLPVRRYSAESLARELGEGLRLVESASDDHVTPGGAVQRFVFARLVRV